MNRPADQMAPRRLLAGQTTVSAEQAAAPSFDLKALAARTRDAARPMVE